MDFLLQQADHPQLNLNRMRVKAYTLAYTPQLFPSPCSVVFILLFFEFSKAFELLIAGGTETAATVVEWGLSELLKNPETLERAMEELDRVAGRERWVEEKDYLQWVVKETTRSWTVTMLVPRLST